jgi:hypothetical protein
MNNLLSTIAVFMLLSLSVTSYSQTEETDDVATTPATQSLESEYLKELDRWMLQAYEGDREAQFKVGVLFTNDQFKSADLGQSVYWYKQAARQGHAPAQYNLGHQYLTGSGVKRNESEAMKWWLKAAEQDHPLAQFNVGRAYYLGIGLKEDHAQSRLWFKRAAKNNEPKSIDILTQLNWSEPGEFKNSNESRATEAQLAAQGATTNNSKENGTITKAAQATSLSPSISIEEEHKTEALAAKAPTKAPTKAKPLLKAELIDNEATSEASIEVPDTDEAAAIATIEAPELRVKKDQDEPQRNNIQSEPNTDNSNPIAVYTNPAKRSVLIAILKDPKNLKVVSRNLEWTEVTSEVGFPVWVHRDYIVVADDIGAIQGNAVNARSVPLITSGTIVGRLNDNDTLAVIDQKNAWYRVMSPNHFKAWVKTNDLYRKNTPVVQAIAQAEKQVEKAESSQPNQPSNVTSLIKGKSAVNDNAWLFSQPADGYTLQLASFDDPEKVAEFRSRSKFIDNPDLHSFTSESKNITWTYFLFGEYGSSETAKQARLKINQKLAWVRSFGKLQQNRCLAWKKQLPPPKALNKYCS